MQKFFIKNFLQDVVLEENGDFDMLYLEGKMPEMPVKWDKIAFAFLTFLAYNGEYTQFM